MVPQLALGRKPFVEDRRDLTLDKYAVAIPPLPKTRFGYGTMYTNWGMLGNGPETGYPRGYGDCAFAGPDHETMLWNKLAGRPVTFTRANALADYAAVTGFDPATGANDDGAVVRDVLNYRRRTGMIDAAGIRHKIDAYVALSDPKDFELMLRCVFTFGAVGLGFTVTYEAMNQFADGKPWDVGGDETEAGGHYVPAVGSTIPGERVTVVTWGKRQFMTRAYYEKWNEEAWVPLSREQLKASGYNARHIDWAGLETDLAAVAGA